MQAGLGVKDRNDLAIFECGRLAWAAVERMGWGQGGGADCRGTENCWKAEFPQGMTSF